MHGAPKLFPTTGWFNWGVLATLTELKTLKIPRFYFPNRSNPQSTQLHVFEDAYELGFGSVAYLRQKYDGGNETSLQTTLAKVFQYLIYRLSIVGLLDRHTSVWTKKSGAFPLLTTSDVVDPEVRNVDWADLSMRKSVTFLSKEHLVLTIYIT